MDLGKATLRPRHRKSDEAKLLSPAPRHPATYSNRRVGHDAQKTHQQLNGPESDAKCHQGSVVIIRPKTV